MNTDLKSKKFAVKDYEKQEGEDKQALLDRIKDFVKKNQEPIQELRERSEKNKELYFATYQDEGKLRVGEEKIMIPKLFENWETLIPIITRTTPEPNVAVLQRETKKSIISTVKDLILRPKKKTRAKLQELLPYFLKDIWQLSKIDGGAYMQSKMEEAFRNLAIEKAIIIKLKYNHKYNVMEPVIVSVHDCIFETDVDDDASLKSFGHYCTYTVGELKKMGCDEEAIDEVVMLEGTKKSKKISDNSIIKLMEYWECENVCLQYQEKVILKTFKNPTYNWEKDAVNHYAKPIIPVIFESDIRYRSGLVSASSYIEVAEHLTRLVDKRKRQINRNAKLANGMFVVDGNSGLTDEDARNLATDTDKTLYLPAGSTVPASQAVQVLTGRSIDQSIVNDMMHSEAHIDKITGVNETVRGERSASETKGGREILKESALSRNEILFRVNERVGQKIYNWALQFLYLKCSDEGYPIYTSGERSDMSGIITPDMLKASKIRCYVKDGSTVPVDKSTRYADAMEKWTQGLISRKHALMLLDEPNYEHVAREKYLEDTAPERLYDKQQQEGAPDSRAIMDIYELIKNDGEVPAMNFSDVKQGEKYIKTIDSYINGDDIDEGDLPSFTELDTEIRRRIIQHTDVTAKKLAQIIAEEQANNPEPQPQQPMQPQAPMPPMPMPGQMPQAPNPMMGGMLMGQAPTPPMPAPDMNQMPMPPMPQM